MHYYCKHNGQIIGLHILSEVRFFCEVKNAKNVLIFCVSGDHEFIASARYRYSSIESQIYSILGEETVDVIDWITYKASLHCIINNA